VTRGAGGQVVSNGHVWIDGVCRSIKRDRLVQLESGPYVLPDSKEAKEYLAQQEKAKKHSRTVKTDQDSLAAYVVNGDTLYLGFRQDDGQYAFAYLDKGRIATVNEVVVNGNTVRPRPLPVVEGSPLEIVGLPSEGMLKVVSLSPDRMFSLVRGHIAKYVDLRELDLELATYYILFTWIYPIVNTVPYLRIISDTGKGKTRAIGVVGDLCFYPLRAGGASSFSGMARTQERWRGTLVIDEADFSGDKDSQITKYLNLGFERGQYYLLSDKQDPKRQDVFNPFCPKVIAMREPFSDNATEGRLLSITMRETTRPDIPIILPSQYITETKQLRDELARFTLELWNSIDGSKMLNFDDLNIEPRLKQLAMPLSVVFQLLPDGAEGFRTYLTARQTEIKRVRAISWVGSIVNAAVAIAGGEVEAGEESADLYNPILKTVQAVTPSMVAKQFGINKTKAVTQALTSAGFQVEKRWITKADGHTKKQVRTYVVPDRNTWSEIARRYIEEGELNDMPQALKSAVYVEVSQPSQVSQTQDFVTDVTDVTDAGTPIFAEPTARTAQPSYEI
jgi:hypothetical protein